MPNVVFLEFRDIFRNFLVNGIAWIRFYSIFIVFLGKYLLMFFFFSAEEVPNHPFVHKHRLKVFLSPGHRIQLLSLFSQLTKIHSFSWLHILIIIVGLSPHSVVDGIENAWHFAIEEVKHWDILAAFLICKLFCRNF